MTRAEKAERVRQLRDERGLYWREIAARLRISKTYACSLYSDPDGSKDKMRKASYGRRCAGCGRKTDGSNGRGGAPIYCADCVNAQRREAAQVKHLALLAEFVRRYGVPPSATDWNPQHALAVGSPDKATRFYTDGCWPNVSTVQQVWGSWSAFLVAGGYPDRRVRQGRPGDDPDVVAETVRLYVDEGLTGAQVAERMGVTDTAVYKRLEVAGVERRARGAREQVAA